MFIYRYMAGLVPDAVFEGIDANYDPHEHRKVSKPITYAETMMHCLKGSFGAGLLAMPDAIRRLGIVFGAILACVIGIFATYCIQMLILAQYQLCKRHKRGYMAYPKSMKLAVMSGPPFMRGCANVLSRAVNVMICIWQFGICSIYLVFVGETLQQILTFNGYEISVRRVIVYSLPIQVAFCLIKDLKLLTPFSSVANIAIMFGVVIVSFYLMEDLIIVSDEHLQLKSYTEIPIFIGIILFALEAVGVVLALEYNMEKPKEFTGLCGLFSSAMCIIVTTFTLLGVFGYLKYGADTKGVITLNLPSEERKAQTAKILFAISLFLSYPLQNYVAWQIILRKLQKKLKPKRPMVLDYVMRLLCALLPYIMASAAPSLGAFMGLVGALTLSLVAVVFPAIIDICVYYPNKYGPLNWKAGLDIFIIIFGTFALCSGVYTSLNEMYEKYEF